MTTRRGFLGALLALPIVARVLPEFLTAPVVAVPALPMREYSTVYDAALARYASAMDAYAPTLAAWQIRANARMIETMEAMERDS